MAAGGGNGRVDAMYAKADKVLGASRRVAGLRSSCVPQTVGKTGFTAACGAAYTDSPETCELYSPFKNKTHAEQMRKLLLTRPQHNSN